MQTSDAAEPVPEPALTPDPYSPSWVLYTDASLDRERPQPQQKQPQQEQSLPLQQQQPQQEQPLQQHKQCSKRPLPPSFFPPQQRHKQAQQPAAPDKSPREMLTADALLASVGSAPSDFLMPYNPSTGARADAAYVAWVLTHAKECRRPDYTRAVVATLRRLSDVHCRANVSKAAAEAALGNAFDIDPSVQALAELCVRWLAFFYIFRTCTHTPPFFYSPTTAHAKISLTPPISFVSDVRPRRS
jgi:hypothetical protein